MHSADGWRDVLEPVVARYRQKTKRRCFRGETCPAGDGMIRLFLPTYQLKRTPALNDWASLLPLIAPP